MRSLSRAAGQRPLAGIGPFMPSWRLLRPALALAAAWAIASGLRRQVDYPLMRLLDRAADAAPPFDRAAAWLTSYYLLSGVLLVTLVWFAWFARPEPDSRARLLAGTIAAFLAGMAGRVLQLTLPTHLRPMHDPVLAMRLPAGVDPTQLNHWSSFPSDHAAVQFGLAFAIGLARPGLGRVALIWVLVLNGLRVYLGAHFPTDILGGAALCALFVQVSQTAPAQRAGRALLRRERRAPAGFYAVAFFMSYQVATLFDEARMVALATAHVLRHLLAG